MLRMWGNMLDFIFYFVEYMCAVSFITIGVISGVWGFGEFLFAIMILWATTMILFCMGNNKKC